MDELYLFSACVLFEPRELVFSEKKAVNHTVDEPIHSLLICKIPEEVAEVFVNFRDDRSIRCRKDECWKFEERSIYTKDDIIGIDLLWKRGHVDIVMSRDLVFEQIGNEQDWIIEPMVCSSSDSDDDTGVSIYS